MSCSEIAQARPKPSYVEVPRPSSSTITSDRLVAPCSSNVGGWWQSMWILMQKYVGACWDDWITLAWKALAVAASCLQERTRPA